MVTSKIDRIFIYIAVVIVSLLVGIVTSSLMIRDGMNEFTTFIFFVVGFLLSILFYLGITILLDIFLGMFFTKKTKQLAEDEQSKDDFSKDNFECGEDVESKSIIIDNISQTNFHLKSEFVHNFYENSTNDNVSDTNFTKSETCNANRDDKSEKEKELLKKKQGIAINYTKEIFKDFLEKENIDIVCNAVKACSEGEMDFTGFSLARIENLTNQDLYHFGWNIWNQL